MAKPPCTSQGSWFIGYMEPEVSANTGVFLLPQDDGDIYVPIYVGGGVRMSALHRTSRRSQDVCRNSPETDIHSRPY